MHRASMHVTERPPADSLARAALLHALCGAKVTMNVPMQWREVRYPLLSPTPLWRAEYSVDRPVPEDFFAACVLPEHSMLVSMLVCRNGATFVYTHEREGVLFTARPQYSLRGIVPDDSVVHAFVYCDRDGRVLLGVFDANKIGGADVSTLAPLTRHCQVFDMYHAQRTAAELVVYHGVYYEHACLQLDSASLHFQASRILRLPQSKSELAYDCVLLP